MHEQILDLHIHSKYSRACSKELELPKIAAACKTRGIDIVATGDFTHPKWFEHLQENLVEVNQGIYGLKSQITNNKSQTNSNNQILNSIQDSKFQIPDSQTKFIIGTELASIKKHAGETRRVHLLLFAPSLEVAGKFNAALRARGINIDADGRPIIGMTSRDILELALETDERMVMIPAHAWTPWFGVFGSKGGYNSLEECFEDLTPHVFAIETGLSSDPLMNWRWSKLDNIALISNSDAHSPAKLGREANVLQFENESEITYDEIIRVIKSGNRVKSRLDRDHAAGFLYTIEFYPEEGKYHFDGHRLCKFVCNPAETKKYKGICPKCKKPLVIGVMNRIEEMADRTESEAEKLKDEKIPYRSLVPLPEIIACALDCGVGTKSVQKIYEQLIQTFGSEFQILLHASLIDIESASSKQIALGIDRVRRGDIFVEPGYDGEFGVVKVFQPSERVRPTQGALELE